MGRQPDGQVRPPPRQVHGLLHAVPWRRGAQGRQRRHRHHQDQAHHPVRRLVPHWLQGGHQLPAAHRGARRRPGQGAARRVHAEQHHGHRRGLGTPGPQVRPHVRQACLRALVRGRGHGGGRVLRGPRGSGRPGEGLRRGRRRLRGGRGGGRGVLSAPCTPPCTSAYPSKQTLPGGGGGVRNTASAVVCLYRLCYGTVCSLVKRPLEGLTFCHFFLCLLVFGGCSVCCYPAL